MTALAQQPAPPTLDLAAVLSEMLEPDAPPEPEEMFRDLPVGENGERFDFDQAPWTRVVLQWFMDPAVEWIYLIQGSQTSKTTVMMGLLLFAARYAPRPALWVGAIEEEVDKFVVQRLKPFLTSADPAAKTARKVDWRKSDLRLHGRMLTHFAWATSGKKLRSWPCGLVFGDECGIWPASVPDVGDPLEYVKKRTRRFRDRKGVFATTPSDEVHPAWVAASRADFYRWMVPCPECGEYQYLAFHHLQFGHCKTRAGEWDLERVRRETYYECPHCAARLNDADKARMIVRGQAACVDPAAGTPRPPRPGNTARTLQVPATYSLFTPWGALAAMFLEAQAKGPEALRIFVTDELAEPWKESTVGPDEDMLMRCVDRARPAGVAPEEALVLTAGVDIQADRIYYVVRAWGEQDRSWLVRHGVLPRRGPDEPLDFLDDVLAIDHDGLPVAFTLIDSGFKPDLVYAYCRQRDPRRVGASKGAGRRIPELVKAAPLERTAGKPAPGTLWLYHVDVDQFKESLHARIPVNDGDPRAWRLHADVDADYTRQVLSEARKRVVEAGVEKWKWIVIDPKAGNHYLDCEVLAMAAAWFPVRAHRMRRATPQAERPRGPGFTTPDGRPFFVLDRKD